MHLLFHQSHFMSCCVLSAVNKPICYVSKVIGSQTQNWPVSGKYLQSCTTDCVAVLSTASSLYIMLWL